MPGIGPIGAILYASHRCLLEVRPRSIEVMNAHARLDLRNPRLVAAMLRELTPFFRELSKDQLSAVAPLTCMALLGDEARVSYLSRCAELNMGLPAPGAPQSLGGVGGARCA